MEFIGDNATTTITPNISNTFVTVSDNKEIIQDYSKYTHTVKVVDNLKQFDYPAYSESGNLPFSLPNESNDSNTYPLTIPTFFQIIMTVSPMQGEIAT